MDEDDDPSLLFNGNNMMYEDPCNLVKSLPPIYDKRLDMFRHKVKRLAWWTCVVEDKVDLVEKLLKGGYLGINEIIYNTTLLLGIDNNSIKMGTTLLGLANSIEMADFLIDHGAMFKGRGCNDFDCFEYYIIRPNLHMLEHFFNHPQFIYTDKYMDLAIKVGYDPTIEILKRKRDIHHEDITMSTLFNNFYV